MLQVTTLKSKYRYRYPIISGSPEPLNGQIPLVDPPGLGPVGILGLQLHAAGRRHGQLCRVLHKQVVKILIYLHIGYSMEYRYLRHTVNRSACTARTCKSPTGYHLPVPWGNYWGKWRWVVKVRVHPPPGSSAGRPPAGMCCPADSAQLVKKIYRYGNSKNEEIFSGIFSQI